MDSLSPISRRILRFQGVQPDVLKALETKRLKQDSQVLFGEKLDVFINRSANSGTVDLVAHNKDAKSLPYGSGFIRNLYRKLTGEDIQPVELTEKVNPFKAAPNRSIVNGDIFDRTVRSNN